MFFLNISNNPVLSLTPIPTKNFYALEAVNFTLDFNSMFYDSDGSDALQFDCYLLRVSEHLKTVDSSWLEIDLEKSNFVANEAPAEARGVWEVECLS